MMIWLFRKNNTHMNLLQLIWLSEFGLIFLGWLIDSAWNGHFRVKRLLYCYGPIYRILKVSGSRSSNILIDTYASMKSWIFNGVGIHGWNFVFSPFARTSASVLIIGWNWCMVDWEMKSLRNIWRIFSPLFYQ